MLPSYSVGAPHGASEVSNNVAFDVDGCASTWVSLYGVDNVWYEWMLLNVVSGGLMWFDVVWCGLMWFNVV